MKTLILLLTKGPHRWRPGPRRWHDWVRSCELALELRKKYGAEIYVPSAVKIEGHMSEFDLYGYEFLRLGLGLKEMASTADYRVLTDGLGQVAATIERRAQETIGQIEAACELVARRDASILVVSTWTHFPRVLYLCRGKGFAHRVAFGIPNPLEACTDMALALLFPLLDLLGLGEKFQRWATAHRKSGKHI